jgi:uncharacterized coiled-coil protein SlyX
MTEPTLDERIAKLRKMPYDADRHDAADAIIDEQQREIERLHARIDEMNESAKLVTRLAEQRDQIDGLYECVSKLKVKLNDATAQRDQARQARDIWNSARKKQMEQLTEQQREIERLKEELNWYQTEAVARTNTDARTKP